MRELTLAYSNPDTVHISKRPHGLVSRRADAWRPNIDMSGFETLKWTASTPSPRRLPDCLIAGQLRRYGILAIALGCGCYRHPGSVMIGSLGPCESDCLHLIRGTQTVTVGECALAEPSGFPMRIATPADGSSLIHPLGNRSHAPDIGVRYYSVA